MDVLREEASRIARAAKIDWSIERADEGAHFCFENAEAKKTFVTSCKRFDMPHRDA
ncbi:hypothetical protein [Bradyrhizobium sp. 45]|uniref:hypothetical protein n=1 Tax=Bradyrhizobium sp. 45 TaxID=1043587 RepID=UPI001FFC2448|nr:hypothetical protein [Bradyrhizobium sp. 45]